MGRTPRTRALSHRMSHCVLRYLSDGTDMYSLNSRALSTWQHGISHALPNCALRYLGDGMDTLDKNYIGQLRMSHCALRYTYIGDGMENSIELEYRICSMESHCALKYLFGDGTDSLDENFIYWTAQDIPCSSTACTPTKLEWWDR